MCCATNLLKITSTIMFILYYNYSQPFNNNLTVGFQVILGAHKTININNLLKVLVEYTHWGAMWAHAVLICRLSACAGAWFCQHCQVPGTIVYLISSTNLNNNIIGSILIIT